MKFVIPIEEKHFFRDHNYLELSDVVKPEKLEIFEGRDTWRRSDEAKRFVCQGLFGQILDELFSVSPWMLAFDEVLQPGTYIVDHLFSIQGRHALIIIPFEQTSVMISRETFELESPALVIGYVEPGAMYVFNKRDPHAQGLKKEGFGFGDPIHQPILH